MVAKKTQRPAPTGRKLLVARQSFLAPGGQAVTKDTIVEASDPIVKGREALFSPVEEQYRTTRQG